MKEVIKNLKTQKNKTKKKQKVKIKMLQEHKKGRIMLLSNSVVCDSKNRNLLKSKKLVDY